jgi:hypothetical protein
MRGWSGYGFANLVLALGAKPGSPFPFGIFQLAAFGFCAWKAAASLRERATLGNALRWAALGTFVALFFGRFIHDNYLGVILSIGALAAWCEDREAPPAYNG